MLFQKAYTGWFVFSTVIDVFYFNKNLFEETKVIIQIAEGVKDRH
jgi:hypothetical protein